MSEYSDASACAVQAARLKYDSKYPNAACVTNYNSPYIPSLEGDKNDLLTRAKYARGSLIAKARQEATYLVAAGEIRLEEIGAIEAEKFRLFKAFSLFVRTAAAVESTSLLSHIFKVSLMMVGEGVVTREKIVSSIKDSTDTLKSTFNQDTSKLGEQFKQQSAVLDASLAALSSSMSELKKSLAAGVSKIEGGISNNSKSLSQIKGVDSTISASVEDVVNKQKEAAQTLSSMLETIQAISSGSTPAAYKAKEALQKLQSQLSQLSKDNTSEMDSQNSIEGDVEPLQGQLKNILTEVVKSGRAGQSTSVLSGLIGGLASVL